LEKLYLDKNAVRDRCIKEQFDYAWINTYAKLYLKKIADIKNFDFLDDLIEAKFFNESKEMSVIKDRNDEFSVVIFSPDTENEYIEEKQILKRGKSPFEAENNKILYKIIVRHYIDYDCEGQAYVYYTKLCGIDPEVKKYGK